MEYKDAFDFPKRMNVSVGGSMPVTANENHYVDPKTGKPISGWVPPAGDAMIAAMWRWLEVLEKYEDMILPGYFNFPAPDKIPEDLLMPFVDLVEKYDLAAAVPLIWESTAQGLGDTMNVPAIWVMQASGVPLVRSMLGLVPAVVPDSGRLYDLYENVAKFLGGDVLYSSTVVSADRQNGKNKGVSLRVKGPDGKFTCVKAKRLLLAIEPDAANMAPFKLDRAEADVLGRFQFPTVYAAIIQHPSLQPGHAYAAREPGPESLAYKAFPAAPQFGRIDYIGGTEDLFSVTAVGTQADTTESIQALLQRTVDDMIASGVLPEAAGNITFKAFANHGHMHAHVSADELRSGFIQKLNALQGRRNTYYTGAAFSAGFSVVLWEYNKVLLPELVKGL